MEYKYETVFMEEIELFRESLPESDKFKIISSISALTYGKYKSILVKTLRSPIKELVIKQYRFIFFIDKNKIYFIGAFIKKSNKTPTKEIEKAQKIYQRILEINKKIS